MFGSYRIQIHNLVNHYCVERSLRLMFSHYFIIISINLITVAFEWLHLGGVNLYLNTSIMENKPYYKEGIKFLNGDLVKMLLFTAVGSFVILFSMENIYIFLVGILIITLGNLSVLAKIQKKYLK